MSELVLICSARRIEQRGGRFVNPYKISYGCWLPEGHEGPHWAIVTVDVGSSREPRAWTGTDDVDTSVNASTGESHD